MKHSITYIFIVMLLSGCASMSPSGRRVALLKQDGTSASLQMCDTRESISGEHFKGTDTVTYHRFDGRDVMIMKAVRDEKTGEMVVSDVIDAAVVTARFRNVAERGGKVDLKFRITVPSKMRHSRWQLRFTPQLYALGDSTDLDPVVITGELYRRSQIRGYQQYERFLSRIVSDTTEFVDMHQLEFFLERNIPRIYAFRNDTSLVSDEDFYSFYGVNEKNAVEHYTDHFAKWRNDRRKMLRGRMFNHYVRVPIVSEGIRLDTILVSGEGDFIYDYTQTINASRNLRKADIVLGGAIFEMERRIYTIPRSEPLSFYISSVSSFVEEREMYLKKIIQRRVEANSSYDIMFAPSSSRIDLSLGDNAMKLCDIKKRLLALMKDEEYDLDSIVIVSSSSPEGPLRLNTALSADRSSSIAAYLEDYMTACLDSISRNTPVMMDLHGNRVGEAAHRVPFVNRPGGENWRLLDSLIETDTTLTEQQKCSYRSLSSLKDADRREALLKGQDYYQYVKRGIFPFLRRVDFTFHLHRKGMVKDTVCTFEPDTCYRNGLNAIRERDYERASALLSSYADYNTAVAYICLDRNLSALEILLREKDCPQVRYMKAIVHSRLGHTEEAVQCYLDACRDEPSFVHRGNLDPEISELIRKYNLNKNDDENL